MRYPEKVTIIEVGPRDGLQNEANFVDTDIKIDFINRLSQTGLQYIEVSSFVSAKNIPQLADSSLVFENIKKAKNVHYSALIPNELGMQKALHAGVREIAVFTAASETFNQHNIHCSIAESIQRFIPVFNMAKEHHIPVRAYISCALGCPYEGNIEPQQVIEVSEQLLALGAQEISFGDTIGVATPKQTEALLQVITNQLAIEQIAMHFHDTYGQALANIYASLQWGIHRFDSSVAGLGGCPYARGATGNVATEDVLYLLQGLGIETGIDFDKLLDASTMICKALGKPNQSKVAKVMSLR